LRFCAASIDRASKRSPKSCSALTIT
jgi:hypothetical protein